MAHVCDSGTMPDVAGVTKSGSAICCRKRQIRISPEHRPPDPTLKSEVRLRLFLALEVQIVRIEQCRPLKALKIRDRAPPLLQYDQAILSQFHDAAIDVNG